LSEDRKQKKEVRRRGGVYPRPIDVNATQAGVNPALTFHDLIGKRMAALCVCRNREILFELEYGSRDIIERFRGFQQAFFEVIVFGLINAFFMQQVV
jgi:hypothetical protein